MGKDILTLITIDSIYQKANELIKHNYPLLGDDYIKRSTVEYVVLAIILLDKGIKKCNSISKTKS
jgi:hypothetical protein